MRHWYDTEFIEDGRTIDLISIGIVAEDGREYYAVVEDAPWRRIKKHAWLMANVVPHLPQGHGDRRHSIPGRLPIDFADPLVKHRKRIAEEVRDFLLRDGKPELWADYGAYDHVVLCQLWGTMMDLPIGIPMHTMDVQQEAVRLGVTEFPEQDGAEHNALADARHTRVKWQHLQGVAA
ncbi:3'-5' exoribonuclease domain-containing protein [Saccharopolyspora pogona]|uniref:3'-5' exoribonuclease domain-containing protein n=1 Tax=Saccharopolyspora pogona TaxID=333966 RepID=UPI001686635E|nr:3'-5' exoribonuclease [Saccharopolyspora pogona]